MFACKIIKTFNQLSKQLLNHLGDVLLQISANHSIHGAGEGGA